MLEPVLSCRRFLTLNSLICWYIWENRHTRKCHLLSGVDGSTCFHPVRPRYPTGTLNTFLLPCKNTHPSEDGEALQRSILEEFSDQAPGQTGTEVTTSSQWFALYTTCRHEKRIAQHLSQREIEHYLPLYRAERKWRDGSRVTLDLPLFPSYIFVRIQRAQRVRVLSVPGALAVVGGTGGEPAPLPDTAMDALRAGLQQHRVEPHPLLCVGQLARIRSGAFAGMEGIVVRKKSGLRVVLTLEQIMQSVAVELDEADVEPLNAGRENDGRLLIRSQRLCIQGA
jgi:transcription antitermination factor NusG